MQKKDDKVGNKTTNKEKKEGKKGERERKIEIDGKKKKKKQVQIFCFAHSWKTRKLFNYVRLVGKYAFFFLAKLIFSHSHAN